MTDIAHLDTVICGDCLEVMRDMPTGIVYCVVTSPPYWGLRDYGVDGQLGLEKTPEEYIAKMVAVFREVWRVLRDDGTLWLNLGDSYNSGSRLRPDGGAGMAERNTSADPCKPLLENLKPKDLCGIPWRVALALQADGWYLRQDIIWHKPNPMPESVTDRCTKAHEYIFLMSKKPRYYYDQDAIREDFNYPERKYNPDTSNHKTAKLKEQGNRCTSALHDGRTQYGDPSTGRNKRSVWTVPTCPYPEAHFATFPPKLIEPCILAGCPEWVCKKCGEPRRRIVETEYKPHGNSAKSGGDYAGDRNSGNLTHGKFRPQEMKYGRATRVDKTTGWSDCGCGEGFDGGIVLDPFMGSGTVAAVAYENNRHYVGIDLNPDKKIQKRISDVHDKYALFDMGERW